MGFTHYLATLALSGAAALSALHWWQSDVLIQHYQPSILTALQANDEELMELSAIGESDSKNTPLPLDERFALNQAKSAALANQMTYANMALSQATAFVSSAAAALAAKIAYVAFLVAVRPSRRNSLRRESPTNVESEAVSA